MTVRGEFTSDFKPAYMFCPHCKTAGRVVYRKWESSDGAFEDHQYFCNACQQEWWVDGPDA